MQKISGTVTRMFNYIAFILYAILFVNSILFTATHEIYADGRIQEFAKVTSNNVFVSFALFLLGLIVLGLVLYSFNTIMKKRHINVDSMAVVISLIAFAVSIAWINNLDIIPGADQAFCVQYASAINAGDYSSLEKGHYLSNYPHLLGFVAFLRLLFLTFGDGCYQAFRYFNTFCVPILIYSGYRITKKLSKDCAKAEMLYLLLMLVCVPMYAYVLFVYGDLSGPAFGTLSIWMFLEYIDRPRIKYLIGLFFSLIVAITLRRFIIIFAIAMFIVCIVRLFIAPKKAESLAIIAIAASIVLSLYIPNLFYLPYKVDTSNAIPTAANIAMSMNYDNGFAGWYNYAELNYFYNNGEDVKLASKAAMDDLREVYIPLFLHNPKFTLEFFHNKIHSQWQSPLYQSIVSNNLLYGGQNDFVMSVFFGGVGVFFEYFMKMYQMCMYFCIAFLLWNTRKREVEIEKYVTLIAAFGGFLLSIIWEAKGRYIFPYFLITLPIYAIGAVELFRSIKKITCFKKAKMI